MIWIKWKKQIKHEKNTIYQADKLPFNKDAFLACFNDLNHIVSLELKPSRVNIIFNQNPQVNLEKLKSLKGISGILVNSNKLSIILGEFSQATYNLLKHTRSLS
ncbi:MULTISPECIES: PTS sugar transporter subunit IIABC [unclassified Mycoplasma]|uniref:PTS sugar transporter subunit IIABC n=1 Tax=unclassified Mycoplasma TaxID=2683645 RepID=UPI00211BF06B|nr:MULTISPECIES: PTS sugar transporter subunit IIABC [unclassified Mycoplasma]UUM19503.1 PTS sugar transporter subunit IIABC [Mycoplasma sp. 1578d]UUM25126.1 PTS sugar transporter subunit IIABC [Mycoplasma sp. 3686d]